ncbi:Rho GTPase-activating protein syde2 [Cichlidogyrus casuarinus]|uniref:Rho GTPase-activating protein syde2 n=1 Tax=Cichlidogyrus casuarinus TaxID=1844966 RepID=A0ABD2QDD7_9PLAT
MNELSIDSGLSSENSHHNTVTSLKKHPQSASLVCYQQGRESPYAPYYGQVDCDRLSRQQSTEEYANRESGSMYQSPRFSQIHYPVPVNQPRLDAFRRSYPPQLQTNQELIHNLAKVLDPGRPYHQQYWSDSELAAYEAATGLRSQQDMSALARAAYEAAKAMASIQIKNRSQSIPRGNTVTYPNLYSSQSTGQLDDYFLEPTHLMTTAPRSRQTLPPINFAAGFNSAPAQQGSSYWSDLRGAPSTYDNYISYENLHPDYRREAAAKSYMAGRKGNVLETPGQVEFRLIAGYQQPSSNYQTQASLSSSVLAFTDQKASFGIDGMLVVHVIAGTSLNSNQMILRDLYCVLETESIRKARSMIRTSTNYFEWNEAFELDIEDTRSLSLLLYQWDPKTRHRLCFYGAIDLISLFNLDPSRPNESLLCSRSSCWPNQERSFLTSSFVQRSPQMLLEKVALQLEPRGLLYLEIGLININYVFSRKPSLPLTMQKYDSNANTSILFGVQIEELIHRERRVNKLIRQPAVQYATETVQVAIPFIIRKCANEIERRGLNVVGIYRLSGSVWMKLQIKELFERVSTTIYNGLANEDSNIVANEMLLFLLDHFKRVIKHSDLNKMDTENLAMSLGPVLLYPSPEAAKLLDPAMLEPRRMMQIFKYILEIWPDARTNYHPQPPQPRQGTNSNEFEISRLLYKLT